ncbi:MULTISPECIES: outer membrane lipoprotein carrier protein LolA [unclassified Aliiroseovarius]|uniref:LolA family protein n=1 Tax=unclassified Aliiroseovarius TaxID=2623558 RepID=UPI0015695F32|nr:MULTISPECIES: outer membrane lipoprotein carrier protein LolA [unclassified Aliiroseovarius]NRP13485.1 Outer-membrane lipoprotein carrier protein [Aliiroseovarius sp. xm-d-517]NRP42656.1 Outer-membrane lipoprotein carrier protein [Aliiroseovarius sp. xm-m-339-2]NRP63568.1 Outer-membrane lipoprotein carrier protein [Aliiroseovarius sp. xm-a-151]
MNAFRMMIAAAGVMLSAAPALAEKLSLKEISSYLNGLQTAKAQFTQLNGDGTLSTGTFYIKRPGKARFEYNPPEKALVVVGSQQVAVFDGKSNAGPSQYPLSRTPLSVILAKTVDLSRAKMVTGHSYDGTATTITAQDPDNPQYGNIKLMFTSSPTELRQWIITDDSGTETTVILGELNKGGDLPNKLFSINQEIRKRQ